jgi:hypothetical protein
MKLKQELPTVTLKQAPTTSLRVERRFSVQINRIAKLRWLKVREVTERLLTFGINHADEIFPEPLIIQPDSKEGKLFDRITKAHK